MIINFYLPETDQRLIEKLRKFSAVQRRSFSFIVREALEAYLRGLAARKTKPIAARRKRT